MPQRTCLCTIAQLCSKSNQRIGIVSRYTEIAFSFLHNLRLLVWAWNYHQAWFGHGITIKNGPNQPSTDLNLLTRMKYQMPSSAPLGPDSWPSWGSLDLVLNIWLSVVQELTYHAAQSDCKRSVRIKQRIIEAQRDQLKPCAKLLANHRLASHGVWCVTVRNGSTSSGSWHCLQCRKLAGSHFQILNLWWIRLIQDLDTAIKYKMI